MADPVESDAVKVARIEKDAKLEVERIRAGSKEKQNPPWLRLSLGIGPALVAATISAVSLVVSCQNRSSIASGLKEAEARDEEIKSMIPGYQYVSPYTPLDIDRTVVQAAWVAGNPPRGYPEAGTEYGVSNPSNTGTTLAPGGIPSNAKFIEISFVLWTDDEQTNGAMTYSATFCKEWNGPMEFMNPNAQRQSAAVTTTPRKVTSMRIAVPEGSKFVGVQLYQEGTQKYFYDLVSVRAFSEEP